MFYRKMIVAGCLTGLLSLGGCAVVTVASAAVSVAGTVVSTGITVGSAAVSVAASATKGAVNLATRSSSEEAE